MIENLPNWEKEFILLYFGFKNGIPLTQKQIADRLNYSQEYVSRVIRQVLGKIRLELKKEDIIEAELDEKGNLVGPKKKRLHY